MKRCTCWLLIFQDVWSNQKNGECSPTSRNITKRVHCILPRCPLLPGQHSVACWEILSCAVRELCSVVHLQIGVLLTFFRTNTKMCRDLTSRASIHTQAQFIKAKIQFDLCVIDPIQKFNFMTCYRQHQEVFRDSEQLIVIESCWAIELCQNRTNSLI